MSPNPTHLSHTFFPHLPPRAHTFIEHLGCLTPIGLLFSIAFTYTGFACMTASILWSTNLLSKIHRAWCVAEGSGC